MNEKIELIALPYDAAALEPIISQTTINIHHGKHLATYVNNLNAALAGSGLEGKTLHEIVIEATGGIHNNAGQILNHNLYFTQFAAPHNDNRPTGRLAEAIAHQFGSFEAFKQEFERMGATLFGSGWVWLSCDSQGELHITQESNAGNPIRRGLTPLLTFDVWEHAYYLDYQNRRVDHLAGLWKIINWDEVELRYCAAL